MAWEPKMPENVSREIAEWARNHDNPDQRLQLQRWTPGLAVDTSRGAKVRAARPVRQTLATALGADVDPMELSKEVYRMVANGEIEDPILSRSVARAVGAGLAAYQGLETAGGVSGAGATRYNQKGRPIQPSDGIGIPHHRFDASRLAAAGYLAEKSGKPLSRQTVVGRRFAEAHPGLADSDVIVEAPRNRVYRILNNLFSRTPSPGVATPVISQGVATDALVGNLARGYATWPSMSMVDADRPVGLGYDAGLQKRNSGKPETEKAGYAAISYREGAVPTTVEKGAVLTSADSFSPSSGTVISERAAGKTDKDILKAWYLSRDADLLREEYNLDFDTGRLTPKPGKPSITVDGIINGNPELKVMKDQPFNGDTIKAAFISGRGFTSGDTGPIVLPTVNDDGAITGVKVLRQETTGTDAYRRVAEALNRAEIPFAVEKDPDAPQNLPKPGQYKTLSPESILLRRVWSSGIDELRQAAKGGDAPDLTGMSNFLATDKVPDTIFGIPVVSRREDYTEADLAFFRDHPEAGGYYDMGDEGTPEDGTEEGAPTQADSPKSAYEAEMKVAREHAYLSSYSPIADPLVTRTGRTVRELVYDPGTAGSPGDEDYEDPKDVIADLPKGTYARGGKYYRDVPETRDELEVTTAVERKALERIQGDFSRANGRRMDDEVAAIRARLAAGTIDRTKARELALALKRRRDVRNAQETARDYWSERRTVAAKEGRSPIAKAGEDWKRFYVDTSRVGVLAARHGLSAVRDLVNSMSGADAGLKKMAIARAFGLVEETEDEEITRRNPALDLARNYEFRSGGYRSAAKRTAMRIASGDDGVDGELRRENARRYLLRTDVRDVPDDDYSGLRPGVPMRLRVGTRKVGTGRYAIRQLAGGGTTSDDLSAFLSDDSEVRQVSGGGAAAEFARRNPSLFGHVKSWETLRLKPYEDIGGHAIGYGAHLDADGNPVTAKTRALADEAAATALLARDLMARRDSLKALPGWSRMSGGARQALLDVSMGKDGILSERGSPGLWRDLRAAESDRAKLDAAVKRHYVSYLTDDPRYRGGLMSRRAAGMKTFFGEDWSYDGKTWDDARGFVTKGG